MSNKIIKSCMALAMAVMMLTATVLADPANNATDWEKGMIRVTGMGYAKTGAKRALRGQAQQAARMDAQRKLVEAVKGVNLDAESTMEDLMLVNDKVRTTVSGTIRHFVQIGEPKYYEDGACEVTLEMPLFGQDNSLAQSAFIPLQGRERVPFPQPTTTSIKVDVELNTAVGGVAKGKYTGLVIDCSGLGLEAVMSPVIKNDNNVAIYGAQHLDIEKVIEMGMASYANSANDSISRNRAGDHPLVVKAERVNGIIKGNPVVSVADSDKILIANQSDMFLDNCAVVFVK